MNEKFVVPAGKEKLYIILAGILTLVPISTLISALIYLITGLSNDYIYLISIYLLIFFLYRTNVLSR